MAWPRSWQEADEDLIFDLTRACRGARNSGDWVWETEDSQEGKGQPLFYSFNLALVGGVIQRNSSAIKLVRTWTFRGELEAVELSFEPGTLRSPDYLLRKKPKDEEAEKVLEMFDQRAKEVSPYWRLAAQSTNWGLRLVCQDRKLLGKFLDRGVPLGCIQVDQKGFSAILNPDVVRTPSMLLYGEKDEV